MFNKTNKPTPPAARPQPTPAVVPPLETPNVNMSRTKPAVIGAGARPLSSFGSGLLIEGNISGTGDLHLDGTVRGDVKVSHLIVGESGNIEGKVEADTIEVRGRIVGSITGKQIKLQATAYVEGDITHDQLAIDVGAFFQGRCLQSRRPESAPAVAAVNAPATPIDVGAPSLNSYDLNALSDLK
jgi:cytoskeletal protein CcmA (bactofilin family)